MSKEKFSFNLLKEDGSARVAKINTHRGEIDTPTFMPVGTQATVKSIFIDDVILAGAKIIWAPARLTSSIKIALTVP